VQPGLELPANFLDADATVAIEQAGAVQDGQPADLVEPAVVVPQQHEQVRCGQPFQERWRGHHRTLLPSSCATTFLC
jgi:hypothetical protein